MTKEEWFDRIYGGLIGQAVGDALGAPTEGNTFYGIRDKYGWIDGFVSDDPVGTDDTEYAMLTAQIILKYGNKLTAQDMTQEWTKHLVGQEGGFYGGGFSEMDAIYNLKKGLAAPHTGSDNHEMWSDGTAMRIVPVGLFCPGNPKEAARLAAVEASVSHARDGIYCGQALAASVATAVVSDSWEEVIESGLTHIPQDSWTYRKISEAVEIGHKYMDVKDALEELYNNISIFYYPWADVAPEATALAYGIFAAAKGDYVSSVLGGTNVGRDADTIAAMAGAMAGALHGAKAVPDDWKKKINVIRGHCIKSTAGINVADMASQFVEMIRREEA